MPSRAERKLGAYGSISRNPNRNYYPNASSTTSLLDLDPIDIIRELVHMEDAEPFQILKRLVLSNGNEQMAKVITNKLAAKPLSSEEEAEWCKWYGLLIMEQEVGLDPYSSHHLLKTLLLCPVRPAVPSAAIKIAIRFRDYHSMSLIVPHLEEAWQGDIENWDLWLDWMEQKMSYTRIPIILPLTL